MSDASAPFPDGIEDCHADPPGRFRMASSLLTLLILGGIVAAGLSGALGGAPNTPVAVANADASLVIDTPLTIRNGEFFETRIRVEARRPIADAVLAIAPSLWRDMTVNTMIPAAAEEKFERGSYAFSYGPLDAGATLLIKIDGQINPPLFAGTSGTIELRDGERPLAAVPLSIRVLP